MDETAKAVIARIRRVVGQLEGVGRMVEGARDHVDVLLQLVSAQAAIGNVAKMVLRAHVEARFSDAVATNQPAEREQVLDDLMEVLARYGGLGSGARR